MEIRKGFFTNSIEIRIMSIFVPFVKMLRIQCDYMANVFKKRMNFPEVTITEPIVSNTEPAFSIFKHAISTLQSYSESRFEDVDKETELRNKTNEDQHLLEYMVDLYREGIDKFENCLTKMSSEEIEKKIDFISTIVMHTIHHIGQVMRLQKIAVEKSN